MKQHINQHIVRLSQGLPSRIDIHIKQTENFLHKPRYRRWTPGLSINIHQILLRCQCKSIKSGKTRKSNHQINHHQWLIQVSLHNQFSSFINLATSKTKGSSFSSPIACTILLTSKEELHNLHFADIILKVAVLKESLPLAPIWAMPIHAGSIPSHPFQLWESEPTKNLNLENNARKYLWMNKMNHLILEKTKGH